MEAERVVQLYRAVSPSATVFSKVDEAGSIGGVLQSTLAGDLPVAYECHGPRVPEDIRDADADAILARVIPHPS